MGAPPHACLELRDVTVQSKNCIFCFAESVPQSTTTPVENSILQQVVVMPATYFAFGIECRSDSVRGPRAALGGPGLLSAALPAPVPQLAGRLAAARGQRLCRSGSIIPSCGWEHSADLLLTDGSYSSCPSVNSSLIT